ncbi:MAG: succinyldiaminopimelate transaminase [Methylotetracoccus sp.]|jgi:N-succinyldiaminopimelate aminotransferase|nr:succinyldiaminopimelate transaminase [Methylotetracoccus sp.]
MNPFLADLQPYPFEKLAQMKHGVEPPSRLPHISLSIGEPQHPTPHCISEALIAHLHGLAHYPATRGFAALRQAIAAWLCRRFIIPAADLDPERQVLPVNGTREALFSFAQAVVDPRAGARVLMPNPFYQIYEGAALLTGARPHFLNLHRGNGFLPDFDQVPETVWRHCRLVYVCSPGNPSGAVMPAEQLQRLIRLADHWGFVIASDECYSELYVDESMPPAGLLQAAHAMGNTEYKHCVVFHSLSKRSNAPGLRSGFVAGDAEVLKHYALYRTYQGCAMSPPIQHASIAAWSDETHVRDNRASYRRKFSAVYPIVSEVLEVDMPPAGFYLWPETPVDDAEFARGLFAEGHVTVLPGSFLSRVSEGGVNPGARHVRIALVAPLDECVEAAHRINQFTKNLK